MLYCLLMHGDELHTCACRQQGPPCEYAPCEKHAINVLHYCHLLLMLNNLWCEQLTVSMETFGLAIIQTLLTDIAPDAKVKDAMNEINAATRMRAAMMQKAEADKIQVVKAAEGDAEAKFLAGQGIARQRQVRAHCFCTHYRTGREQHFFHVFSCILASLSAIFGPQVHNLQLRSPLLPQDHALTQEGFALLGVTRVARWLFPSSSVQG
jgi:hypothetical protein